MMRQMNISQEAIREFGPENAGNAKMALEFFLEASGYVDIDDSLQFWIDAQYTIKKQAALSLIQRAGVKEIEPFEKALNTWRTFFLKKLGESGPVVERIGYDPVNLGTAFHEGKLYYPVQTLVKTTSYGPDGAKRMAERVDIVVVRSDRTVLYIDESTDEKGRPTGIIRLTDGTLLQKRPMTSPYASWSWGSIQHYLSESYANKELMVLAARIHRHLMSRVWLPDPDDYWLLTCAAITSYVQAVFHAVPLILLNGKAGTGKSELGASMAEVSCNAVMIGQTSPPSMMRLMDEARGLVVIDDLESIGIKGRASGKDKFSEMVQVLKVSYKKSSATKIVTNSRKKTEVMNFYGVKIVSNTAGVDEILGSRMLHVSTTNMPKSAVGPFLQRKGLSSEEVEELRNDLHIWAFDNVEKVSQEYMALVAESSQRDEEIAAPLKIIAKLSLIPDAVVSLNRALEKQASRKSSFASPEEALQSVMDIMLREGASVLSISEISLALRRAMNKPYDKKNVLLWMKPEWISKKIRSLGYVEENHGRKNLFGFQMRLIRISPLKIIEAGVGEGRRSPVAFCAGCATCEYRTYGCEIMPYRARKEGVS